MSIHADIHEITVNHKAIPGFMGAMTMNYVVKDKNELAKLKPGDEIKANLIVEAEGISGRTQADDNRRVKEYRSFPLFPYTVSTVLIGDQERRKIPDPKSRRHQKVRGCWPEYKLRKVAMMDVLGLLRKKELALSRVRREVEALRLVAPLLMDDTEVMPSFAFAERTGTDDLVSSTEESWGLIKKLRGRLRK